MVFCYESPFKLIQTACTRVSKWKFWKTWETDWILYMYGAYATLCQITTLTLSLQKKKKSWSFSLVLKYSIPQSYVLFICFLKAFIEFVTILFLGFFVFFNVLGFCGHKTCGILAPQPGIKPTGPVLGGEAPTTEPPGKSSKSWFKYERWE